MESRIRQVREGLAQVETRLAELTKVVEKTRKFLSLCPPGAGSPSDPDLEHTGSASQ